MGALRDAWTWYLEGILVVRSRWARLGVIALVMFVAFVASLAIVVSFATSVLSSRAGMVVDGQLTTTAIVTLLTVIALPLAVVNVVVWAFGSAATSRLIDDAAGDRRVSVRAALRRGVRRLPAAAGSLVLAGLVIAASIVLAPLLVVAGLVGLILTPTPWIKRRRAKGKSWPSVRNWVVLAVPFAPAVVLTVRWSLALPAATLEANGPRAALARSAAAVEEWLVPVAAALIASVATSAAIVALVRLGGQQLSTSLGAVLEFGSSLLMAALPVAVLTVIFRSIATPDGAPTGPDPLDDSPLEMRPAMAGLLVMALSASALVAMPGVASAAPGEPGVDPIEFVVNDDGDTSSVPLAPCADPANTCTLRAAIEEANAAALVDPLVHHRITFDADYTIELSSPLVVSSDLIIDGADRSVVVQSLHFSLASHGSTQLFIVDAGVDYLLRGLTLFKGMAGTGGGGAIASSGNGAIDGVTFVDNDSTGPGGALAVLAGHVDMTNATFTKNQSTNAADIHVASGATVAVAFSTFVGASSFATDEGDTPPPDNNGGSIAAVDAGAAVVSASIVAPTFGTACANVVQGDVPNLEPGAATCGVDVGDFTLAHLGELADNGGPVKTLALRGASEAVGLASTSCPATDARGEARVAPCDLGAHEHPGLAPTVTLTTTPAIRSDLGDAVTLHAVVGGAGDTPTRWVTFAEGATELGDAWLAAGAADVDVPPGHPMGAGLHTFSATYEGDENYLPGAASVDHTVGVLATVVTVSTSPWPSQAGDTVTIEAEVSSAGAEPTGTVTFTSDLTSGAPFGEPVAMVGGTASFATALTDLGEHTITAAYSGDAEHDTNEGTAAHTVRAVATQTLSVTPDASVVGEPVVLTSTVTSATPATGDVQFMDGLVELGTAPVLAGGVATLTTSTLALGDHTIVANYPGDDAVGPATSAGASVTVSAASTTTTVTTDPASPAFGDVAIMATVAASGNGSGLVTGTVTFYDGVTSLGQAALVDTSGTGDGPAVATLHTDALSVGDHTLAAVYEQAAVDPSYLTSTSDDVDLTVVRAVTTTTVAPLAATTLGQAVTLSVTVATGSLPAGTPTGDVVVSEGLVEVGRGTLDGTGATSVELDPLGVGDHALTVDYVGDTNRAPSFALVDHVVGRASTSLDLVGSPASSQPGEPVTFTATVTSTGPADLYPTGVVTFSGWGPDVEAALVDGIATIDLTPPLDGASLTATYPGDDDHLGSFDDTSQLIDPGEVTLTLSTPGSTMAYGDTLQLSVELRPVTPAAIEPSGQLRIFIDGVEKISQAVTGDTVVAVTSPGPLFLGARTIHATFTSAHWVTATSDAVEITVEKVTPQVSLTVSPTTAPWGTPTVFTATVSSSLGAVEGDIEFRDGGVLVATTRLTTVGGAQRATLSRQLSTAGVHQLTATFVETAVFTSATSNRVDVTALAHPTTVTYGDPTVTWSTDESRTWEFFVDDAGATYRSVPTGELVLTLDGFKVDRVGLAFDSAGRSIGLLTLPPVDPGVHDAVVSYVPSDTRFTSSTWTYTVDVGRVTTVVTIDVPVTSANWGEALLIGASVASSPLVVGDPTGQIVISDELGPVCSIAAPAGTCTATWDTPGTRVLTATYEGDQQYVGELSTRFRQATVTILKRPSVITGTLAPLTPVTGDPFQIDWTVTGPSTGTVRSGTQAPDCVTAVSGSVTGAFSGSCTGAFSRLDAGRPIGVGLAFDGDALYEPASWSTTVTPLACVPLRLTMSAGGHPSPGASFTVAQSPNCNGGTGYIASTDIDLLVTPPNTTLSEAWETSVDGVVLDGPGPFTLPRQVTDGTLAHHAFFAKKYVCFEVTIWERGSLSALPSVTGATQPNCPQTDDGHATFNWESSGGLAPDGSYDAYRTGRFLAGTAFATPLYSASGLPGAEIVDVRINSRHVVILPRVVTLVEDLDLYFAGGIRCHPALFDVTGDAEVQVLSRSLCTDPVTGLEGWPAGHDVSVRVIAPPGQYLHRWGNDRPVWWEFECVGVRPDCTRTERRVYSVSYTMEAVRRITFEAGATRTAFATVRQPVHVAGCSLLNIAPFGLGTVDVRPAVGDCPISLEENSYSFGANISVTATPELGGAFGKWNHPLLDAELVGLASEPFKSTNFNLVEDTTLRPSFPRVNGCPLVRIDALVPDRATTTVGADAFCRNGTLRDEQAAVREGRVASFDLMANILQGDPLFGWVVRALGAPNGPVVRAVAGDQSRFRVDADSLVTLTLCQSIQPIVNLKSPRGIVNSVQDAPPVLAEGSWERAAWNDPSAERAEVASLGDVELARLATPIPRTFVAFDPAPNCPFDANAWIVGTTVRVTDKADPAAYGFTGWPDGPSTGPLEVTLNGALPEVRIDADYNVRCYVLDIGGHPKDVTTLPTPNCPDEPASEMMFLHGSNVALLGRVPDGKVWEGWSGDVIGEDGLRLASAKTNPVFVTMDGDKQVQHRYRDKRVDEVLVDAFVSAGDWVATAFTDAGVFLAGISKKAVGFLAAGIVGYAKNVPPTSFIFAPKTMFDVLEVVVDGYSSTVEAIGDGLGVDLSAMIPDEQCWTQEGIHPDGTTDDYETCSLYPRDMYETLEAWEEATGLLTAGLECTSVFGLSGGGSYAGYAAEVVSVIIDLRYAVKDLADAAIKVDDVIRLGDAATDIQHAAAAAKVIKADIALSAQLQEAQEAGVKGEDINALQNGGGLGWDWTAAELGNTEAWDRCVAEAEPTHLLNSGPFPHEGPHPN